MSARYGIAVLVVGVMGAAFGIAFRLALHHGTQLLLGTPDVLQGFAALPRWERLLFPAAGAAIVWWCSARRPASMRCELFERSSHREPSGRRGDLRGGLVRSGRHQHQHAGGAADDRAEREQPGHVAVGRA
ncbi:MAG TPA: hypothetical protein VLW85_13620, partial [Myxococcales bacterium]|nr:hypothetical protein [Myxococcales bacterium]